MLSHGELQLPPPPMWRTARHRDGGIELVYADFLYSQYSRFATPPGLVYSGEYGGLSRALLAAGAGTVPQPGASVPSRLFISLSSVFPNASLLICGFPGSRSPLQIL